MSAEKSRPGEKAALPLNALNKSTAYPFQITLSARAEKYLEQLGMDLLAGRVDLWQLSPALLQFWTFAFEDGRLAHDSKCQSQIDRLSWERDLFYFQMSNPGKTARDSYAGKTAGLWAEASA